MVIHEIQDNTIDITLLTETWPKDNEHHKAWVNQYLTSEQDLLIS